MKVIFENIVCVGKNYYRTLMLEHDNKVIKINHRVYHQSEDFNVSILGSDQKFNQILNIIELGFSPSYTLSSEENTKKDLRFEMISTEAKKYIQKILDVPIVTHVNCINIT